MPNIMSALKAEIVRLARKQIKLVLQPAKRVTAAQRALIAGLRKQVAGLQKEVALLKRAAPKAEKTLAATEPQGRFWITGKGVKALRRKLGLTQAQFGRLAQVSIATVVNWEGTDGKIEIRRKATEARLQSIRGMGKRQAAVILGQGKKAAAKAKAKPKAQKKPKKTKSAKVKPKRKAKKT